MNNFFINLSLNSSYYKSIIICNVLESLSLDVNPVFYSKVILILNFD